MSSVEITTKGESTHINFKGAKYLWFVQYMDGYYRSTYELLEKINQDNETLIYPILLCFSQYMELWIKLLFLASYDSNNINTLHIGSHNVCDLIKKFAQKEGKLLEKCNVALEEICSIREKFRYFQDFGYNGDSLSIVARFPLPKEDDGTTNLAVDLNKIDEAKADNFERFKGRMTQVLQESNQVTLKFLKNYFGEKLADAAIDIG